MNRHEDRLSLVLRAALPLLFLWMIREELVPVALGALFALLLDPLRRRLEPRLGRFAQLAPAVVTAAVIVLVVIPFVLVAARVAVSMNSFVVGGLPDVLGKMQAFVTKRLEGMGDFVTIEKVRDAAVSIAQKVGTSIAGFAAGVATALPGQIVSLFLFTLALFYFLRDGERLVRWLSELSPFEQRDTQALFASIRETVHGAIFGQLATSAVQGGLTLIGLWIFGVPGALLFGVIATLLSILPMVGTTPVTVGAAIYLLAVGRPLAAVGMAVAAGIIGVSDNIVRPWVTSAQTNIHPLVTLIAIFGGIEFFGASGVFLGPVLAAVAIWAVSLHARIHHVSAEPPPADRPSDGPRASDAHGSSPK
ncbi:Putative membrane protein [Minicystis rosea]|nr:Putative membrane protein [Minicystis rosea]